MRPSHDADDRALLCFDRVLALELSTVSEEVARAENPDNARRRPFEAAGVPRKRWAIGRRLPVHFLDGSSRLWRRVAYAAQAWARSGNFMFDFDAGPEAPIRITFENTGAWSAIGTDALVADAFPPSGATMSLSVLRDDSSEEDVQRYTLHEFGHALGLIHEHQSPAAGIQWDRPAVYQAMAGPPNYWDQATADVNFFDRYEQTTTQYTAFDPASIMLYAFPSAWTLDGTTFETNTSLSPADRSFISALPVARRPVSGDGHRRRDGTGP